MEDDLPSQSGPKAEEIRQFQVAFYNFERSSMLATKFSDLSSKTANLRLICREMQPFFIYLSSLISSSIFIKSNCGFKFGRAVAE